MSDDIIQQHFSDLAHESFPDNQDVVWNILSKKYESDLAYIEAEPKPDEVGYPKFMFVIKIGNMDKPTVLGCYCWEAEEWSMLFGHDPLKSFGSHDAQPKTGCMILLGAITLLLHWTKFITF